MAGFLPRAASHNVPVPPPPAISYAQRGITSIWGTLFVRFRQTFNMPLNYMENFV
jgi:hypothetical protein